VEELFTQPDDVKTTRTLAWERLSNSFEPLEEGEESTVYVHTGATGTSIHIDREHDMAVIILTNRTHADGSSRDIKELRRSVATIASYAIVE
jgi:CubicO group peptidase (beta-lactamase class C family)